MAYTTAYPTVASYFDKYHQSAAKPSSSSSRPKLHRSSTSSRPVPVPVPAPAPVPVTPMYPESPISPYSYSSSSGSSSRTRSRSFSKPPPVIDSLLAYHSRSNVPIKYDFSHPPSQATLTLKHSSSSSVPVGLSPSELDRPAAYPPLDKMYITCPYLPWTVTVYPLSSHRNVVTIGDVLETVFRSLRKHASEEDWNRENSKARESVRQAWLRRVKRQHTQKDREYERAHGLRRIDWLEKATVFQGLEPATSHKNTWILHVKQGDKTVKFWNGS